MSLIRVTSKERNGKAYSKDMLIETDRVVEPIVENVGSDSIIVVDESPVVGASSNPNKVQYIVDEDLATIAKLNNKVMFIGTVVSRDGRTPVSSSLLFVIDNITGVVVEHPSGSSFLYNEPGAANPVEYVLSESINDIALAIA